LGFQDQVIALQQDGAPMEGFLRYVQSNPTKFNTTSELVDEVRKLVRAKRWSSNYSRNLVVGSLTPTSLISYADHTGPSQHVSWQARIENKRPDAAAVGAVCILDSINGYPSSDRANLKWAGHHLGYQRTVLPQDFGMVDLCAVRADRPGLFLLSELDITPRQPIVTNNGDYELAFKIFAQGFPLLQFTVTFHLQWQPATPALWTNQSTAAY
jgi:hypothetical protein